MKPIGVSKCPFSRVVREDTSGFSRIDVAVSLCAISLLVWSAMGMATAESARRAGCANNLRQIVAALQSWGGDHEDLLPWVTPVSEGGTRPVLPKSAAAWAEVITLSNYLASPRFLACPADRSAKPAADWSNGPRGFANATYRGNGLSYFVSYHGRTDIPRSIVLGDRDLYPTEDIGACSYGNLVNAWGFAAYAPNGWTNALHAQSGHLTFMDGSISFVGSAELGGLLNSPISNASGNCHFIGAR